MRCYIDGEITLKNSLMKISCYYTDEIEKVEGPLQNVAVDEVLRALKKMKNNKTTGPSKITSDLIKMVGEFSNKLSSMKNVPRNGKIAILSCVQR